MKPDIVKLSDIDISRLKLVKESLTSVNGLDHARWIFRRCNTDDDNKQGVQYVKIWNPRHVRRDNLLRALDIGFYDASTASALSGIIFHKGICRGYITGECMLTHQLSIDFIRKIEEKTRDTLHFAIQFQSNHAGLYNGAYSLFDLEGVHPLFELTSMPTLRSIFDDPAYFEFVASLFVAEFPDRRHELESIKLTKQESSWMRELRQWMNSVSALSQTRSALWRTRQSLKIVTRRTHTHLIEF